MHKTLKKSRKLESIDAKMLVIRDFIDLFYNETVFKNGKGTGTDLSPSFIKAIFAFVDENGEYPIGELGENARVKKSTVTDMVDRLERDGYAERIRDKKDRRVVKVRLTAKGKKVRGQFIHKRREEFQTLFAKLKEEDTLHLVYHLDEAAKILKKIE